MPLEASNHANAELQTNIQHDRNCHTCEEHFHGTCNVLLNHRIRRISLEISFEGL